MTVKGQDHRGSIPGGAEVFFFGTGLALGFTQHQIEMVLEGYRHE